MSLNELPVRWCQQWETQACTQVDVSYSGGANWWRNSVEQNRQPKLPDNFKVYFAVKNEIHNEGMF